MSRRCHAPTVWARRFSARRPGRRRDERGASALILVCLTLALFTVAGVVIDHGYALAEQRQAMNHAEQAARAGSDALNTAALRDGNVRVDPGRAAAAARSYLSSVGATGSVSVNGGEVTVTVTSRQKTAILTVVGIDSIPVTATASAESITTDEP